MIPYLRLYTLSIFNYIKYEVLPKSFTEEVTGSTLTQDITGNYVIDTNPKSYPNPLGEGRGLVMFDEVLVGTQLISDLTSEQTTKCNVPGVATYSIDYLNGRVLNASSAPTTIDYSWNYVSTIIGWPGDEPPQLPIVAIVLDSSSGSGFQLGGGVKDSVKGDIHVFATSELEKQDISNAIYKSLNNKSLTIGNWHEGSFSGFEGEYTGFVPQQEVTVTRGALLDVSTNLVLNNFDWSELNRYRSSIRFSMEVLADDVF